MGLLGERAAGEGGIPRCSLPALATSLLRLSARELPGAALLCAFGPGPRALLGVARFCLACWQASQRKCATVAGLLSFGSTI